jgi:hypothetical protein
VRLCVHKEGIGLARAVIYESNHVESDTLAAVWRLKGGAMSPGCLTVRQNTADDAPNSGRITAALSCAANWEDLAMFVVFIGICQGVFSVCICILEVSLP